MIHFLRNSSVGPRPEPVQGGPPPWGADSQPLLGLGSSWTEPGRCRRKNTLLAKEMNLYELNEEGRRLGRTGAVALRQAGRWDSKSDPVAVPWHEALEASDTAPVNGADPQ